MTKVIAHRGFSGEYPENTLLAFRKAIEAGCDGIELDVQLSGDGEIMIMHDERLDRTTDGSGLLREHTLEQLRSVNAAARWEGRFPQEPVPTLRDYFELVKDSAVLTNIELKNSVFWYEGMEEKVVALIRKYRLEDRILFSSFNHESIALCRSLAPEIPRAFLYDCRLIDSAAYAKSNGVQYLHPAYHNVDAEAVRRIHDEGIGLNVWTVNGAEEMEYFARCGVDGIITNFPDKCRKIVTENREA